MSALVEQERDDVEVAVELLKIGREHGRYEALRIACVVVYGESVTARAESLL